MNIMNASAWPDFDCGHDSQSTLPINACQEFDILIDSFGKICCQHLMFQRFHGAASFTDSLHNFHRSKSVVAPTCTFIGTDIRYHPVIIRGSSSDPFQLDSLY
jgi:hypothetical protein